MKSFVISKEIDLSFQTWIEEELTDSENVIGALNPFEIVNPFESDFMIDYYSTFKNELKDIQASSEQFRVNAYDRGSQCTKSIELGDSQIQLSILDKDTKSE